MHAATLVIGLAVPLAGRDAQRGLSVLAAAQIAVDDARAKGVRISLLPRDTAAHIANPHQDEGSDDAETPASAERAVDELVKHRVSVVVGGLRPPIANAIAATARRDAIGYAVLSPLPSAGPPTPQFAARFHRRMAQMPTREAFAAYRATQRAIERVVER